jgi:hypothetical protein
VSEAPAVTGPLVLLSYEMVYEGRALLHNHWLLNLKLLLSSLLPPAAPVLLLGPTQTQQSGKALRDTNTIMQICCCCYWYKTILHLKLASPAAVPPHADNAPLIPG